MRYVGMIAIALACVCAGWWSAQKLSERARIVDAFIQTLLRLKVEIGFSANTLEVSSRNIAKSSEILQSFWNDLADALHSGSDVVNAWEWAMTELPLHDNQAEILRSFASVLGRSDRANQCERIDITIEALKIEVASLKQDAKEKGKVRRALGALAGVALIIVLI